MIKSYCDKIVCVRNCIKNVMIKFYGDKLFIKLYQEMYWKVTIKVMVISPVPQNVTHKNVIICV